jgi:hypothetical protein
MKPIKDNTGLFRDEKTNAVINTNDVEFDAYLAEKNRILSEKKDIDNMKKDIDEIKDALHLIINKLNT